MGTVLVRRPTSEATAAPGPFDRPRRIRSRPAGTGRALSLPLALSTLLLAGACAPEPEAPDGTPTSLVELERYAFLPPGQVDLFRPPLTLAAPLLVDRYEVTRGDWRRFVADSGFQPPPLLAREMERWPEGSRDWPVSFVTLDEAREFARWRGARVPTAIEWLYVAIGTQKRIYPWGQGFQESVANTLELGLGRPLAVGTFETGATPQGCFDLLGNVSEWVVDQVPTGVTEVVGDRRVSVLGRSFRSWHQRLYDGRSFAAISGEWPVNPASRATDVGFRCVVDARLYLTREAATWGDQEAVIARLEAVGRQWGRPALPLLRELATRPGAPAGLRALARGAEE